MALDDVLTRSDDLGIRTASFDEIAFTAEVVAATRSPVLRRDSRGPFLEILDPAGCRLPVMPSDAAQRDGAAGADVPLLADHEQRTGLTSPAPPIAGGGRRRPAVAERGWASFRDLPGSGSRAGRHLNSSS